jgi:hypothetical protein
VKDAWWAIRLSALPLQALFWIVYGICQAFPSQRFSAYEFALIDLGGVVLAYALVFILTWLVERFA